MGFNVYSLPHFFPYQYWESPVDTSISATKYITLDSIHYTCFLTWPHMAQGYPGQDKRSMFNSRQSFVDCVSAGAGRHYLCLQWPGEAAAAARRGPLLTADLLNTAEMASIVTIQPPTVFTFKILEEKDFGPNYFDSKKNQFVNKSFIISTNKQLTQLYFTFHLFKLMPKS